MDFSEYVAARRTRLVRTTVLLGCPAADAEDIVQSVLLRCYRAWPRVTRADSRDAYVHRVLVNVWRMREPVAGTASSPPSSCPRKASRQTRPAASPYDGRWLP